MSTTIRARKGMRRGVAAAIIAAMLATAAPAHAQLSDNDTATAVTGNGGSVLIALNVVLLDCVLLVASCGNFGGGNGTGGNSGNALATNMS